MPGQKEKFSTLCRLRCKLGRELFSSRRSGEDIPRSVASFGNGNLYLIGDTRSYDNIASLDAHQENLAGERDAFVAKYDIYGDRKWCSYYGGTADEFGRKISKYGFDGMIAFGTTESTCTDAYLIFVE